MGKKPSPCIATLCQNFELSPRGDPPPGAAEDLSDIYVAEGAGGHSTPILLPGDCVLSETLSSIESMDEGPLDSSDVVRGVPNVKAAPSLKAPSLDPKTSLTLTTQQNKNLAKRIRRKQAKSA